MWSQTSQYRKCYCPGWHCLAVFGGHRRLAFFITKRWGRRWSPLHLMTYGKVVIHDHNDLPTSFGYLTDNALVYINGFVVKKVVMKLLCDTCRNSLVSSNVQQFDSSYHFLQIKNNGGLVIPSAGVVFVVCAAEHVIRGKEVTSATYLCSASGVDRNVRACVGSTDIFKLGNHIIDSQHGIENHHYRLMSLVARSFYRLRRFHLCVQSSLTRELATSWQWGTRY